MTMHPAPPPITARAFSRRALLGAGGAFTLAASWGGGRVAADGGELLFGPANGRLVHPPRLGGPPNEEQSRDMVPLAVADYALAATFRNPYPALFSNTFDQQFRTPDSYRQWSYGFGFRETARGGGTVFVRSEDRSWNATVYVRDAGAYGGRRVMRMWRGGLPDLRLGGDDTNDLAFTAVGAVGLFVVNGSVIAGLNLAELPEPGDASIGTGYGNVGFGLVPGAVTEYEGFSVSAVPAPLPPAASLAASCLYGPASGGIRMARQGANGSSTNQTGEGFATGATTRDGIINARFFAPYDAANGPWDCGFWFRIAPSIGGYYSLALRSDATYILNHHRPVSRAYYPTEVQRGPLPVWHTDANTPNDVRLRMDGPDGSLAANGHDVARLDLHDLVTEGSVSVRTAMTVPSQMGAVTRYEKLFVAP